MKKLFVVLSLFLLCSVSFAQSGGVLSEVKNVATVRRALHDALQISACGTNSFATTATLDSITGITGLTATSVAIVTAQMASATAIPDSGDHLGVWCGDGSSGVVGTLYVSRTDAGTSGLKYFWAIIKWE